MPRLHTICWLLAFAIPCEGYASFGGSGRGTFSDCLLYGTVLFGLFGGLWICIGVFAITLAVACHPQRSRMKQALLGILLGGLVWPVIAFAFCAVLFSCSDNDLGGKLGALSGLATGLTILAAAAYHARSAPSKKNSTVADIAPPA